MRGRIGSFLVNEVVFADELLAFFINEVVFANELVAFFINEVVFGTTWWLGLSLSQCS